MMRRTLVSFTFMLLVALISCAIASFSFRESSKAQYISIARVELDGKYGYINGYGNEVLPPVYDEASDIYENRITVRKGESWYIYDVQGNLLLDLADQYSFVGLSGDDLFYVSGTAKRNIYEREGKQKYSYDLDLTELVFIDLAGEEVVTIRPDFFVYDLWPTQYRYRNGYLQLETPACASCASHLIGFADKSGQIVLPPVYYPSTCGGQFSDGLLYAADSVYADYVEYETRFGFIDTAGVWIIDPEYDYECGSSFKDGAAILQKSQFDETLGMEISRTVVVDKQGRRLFGDDVFAHSYSPIQDSTVIVYREIDGVPVYALAKTDGMYLTDFQYDYISNYTGRGHYLARSGDSRYYLRSDDEIADILSSVLEYFGMEASGGSLQLESFVDGLAIVYLENGPVSIIDMNGEIIKTFDDYGSPILEGGLIKVYRKKSERNDGVIWDYYDRQGKLVPLKEYDEIGIFQFLKL